MAAPTPTADPLAEGDRYFRVTNQDHRGVILVVSIICTIYLPMLLGLRGTFDTKTFAVDDYLAIVVTVIALIQNVLLWVAVSHGLGRAYIDVGSSDAGSMAKLLLSSIVLFLIGLALTKCCIILFCRRLFSVNMKRHQMFCNALAVVCGIWGLGSILAVTVSCDSLRQIGYRTSFCPSLTTRWTAVAVLDGITEVLTFMLSLAVIVPLHMSRDRKISVLLTFAPRLATIVLTGLHARYMRSFIHSGNPGVEVATPTVYRQVLLLFSIASAALPALNRRLRSFNTTMGSAWMQTTTHSHGSGKNTSERGAIALKSIGKSKGTANKSQIRSQMRSKRRSQDDDETTRVDDANFRPDKVHNNTTAYWGRTVDPDAQSGQSHDSQNSEAKIIRKDVQWKVHYENDNAAGAI